MDESGKVIIEFLNSAKKFADQVGLPAQESPAYLTGKAVAYFNAARRLAEAVSPEVLKNPAFGKMKALIEPLCLKYKQAAPKPPEPQAMVEMEGGEKVFILTPKTEVQAAPPKPVKKMDRMEMFKRVEQEFQKKGYKQTEATIMTFGMFDDTKSLEELLQIAAKQ